MEPSVSGAFVGGEYGPRMVDVCIVQILSISRACEIRESANIGLLRNLLVIFAS